MEKLVFLSVLLFNVVWPARTAIQSDARYGLKRAVLGCALFNLFYLVFVIWIVPRIF